MGQGNPSKDRTLHLVCLNTTQSTKETCAKRSVYFVPKGQYTCHVSHIVVVNLVALCNWNDAIRSQIVDFRSSPDALAPKNSKTAGEPRARATIVAYVEGQGLRLLQQYALLMVVGCSVLCEIDLVSL